MNPQKFRISTGFPTVRRPRRRRPRWSRPPLRWYQYGAIRLIGATLALSLLAALCNR